MCQMTFKSAERFNHGCTKATDGRQTDRQTTVRRNV